MRLSLQLVVMIVLLDFTNYVWMLPPPSRPFMDSVNMKHILKWLPLQARCDTAVLYSVQFQGEFELLFLNGSWVDAHECQDTRETECDLTFDLGSDSDYSLRIRARCGSQLSPWSQQSRPFNRRDTVLTVPEMKVTVVGDAIQVSFSELPLSVAVSVTVWKRGEEQQPTVYRITPEQTVLQVAALQEGAMYCVRAQTEVNTAQVQHSSSTDTQCVSVTGPDAAWKRPTTVTVTVIIMAGLLFAVFWSVVHCRPEACQTYFRKESLPSALTPEWDIQILKSPEESELCQQIHVVPSVDP